MNVEIPIIHLSGGLHIVLGGFVEIDDSNQDAVVLTYVGGSKRELNKVQSDEFLIAVHLKQSKLVAPAPFFGRG